LICVAYSVEQYSKKETSEFLNNVRSNAITNTGSNLIRIVNTYCPECDSFQRGTNGEIVDMYGSPINLRDVFKTNTVSVLEYDLSVWSAGKNQRDEGGQGDDILYGPVSVKKSF
jgi:hypothetical protein